MDSPSASADVEHVHIEDAKHADAQEGGGEQSPVMRRRQDSSAHDGPAEGVDDEMEQAEPDGNAPRTRSQSRSRTVARSVVDRATLISVALVFLTVAIDMMGVVVILPVIPFYALKFNADSSEVGIVFSSYAVAQFLSVPISGRLSDRFGRRPMILISLIGSAGGFVFQALSESLEVFIAARFVGGVMGASAPLAMAYVADVIPLDQRPRYMALLGTVIALSFMIGPSIGSGLAEFGLNVPMWVSAGLSAAAFLVSWFKLRESKKPNQPTEAASRSRTASVAAALPAEPEPEVGVKAHVKQFVVLICLCEFFNMAAFTGFLTMLGILVDLLYHMGSLELGFIFSGSSIAYIIIQTVVFPRLALRIGKHGAVVVGGLIHAVGMVIIGAVGHIFGLLLVGIAFISAGYGLVTPALPTLMSRYARKEAMGESIAYGQASQAFGRVISPPLLGLAFAVHHSIPFYICAVLAVLLSVCGSIVLLRNRYYKAQATTDSMSQQIVDAEADNRGEPEESAGLGADEPLVPVAPERLQSLGNTVARWLLQHGITAEDLETNEGMAKASQMLNAVLFEHEDESDAEAVADVAVLAVSQMNQA